jgi:hypothetical protein
MYRCSHSYSLNQSNQNYSYILYGHIFIHTYIYLDTYIYLYTDIHPSIHPSVYLSIYRSIHPSIYLSIYIYIHIHTLLHSHMLSPSTFGRGGRHPGPRLGIGHRTGQRPGLVAPRGSETTTGRCHGCHGRSEPWDTETGMVGDGGDGGGWI